MNELLFKITTLLVVAFWSAVGFCVEVELSPSDAAGGQFFGGTVGIDGDTVVGGMGPGFNEQGIRTGTAYVFVREGGLWLEQQPKLLASDGAAQDRFGIDVAISGETIVVGADSTTQVGTLTGSAYVFVRSGSTWTEEQKLEAGDPVAFDSFGSAVAISGDTIVIGAQNRNGSSSGKAYVFTRAGGLWTQQQKLLPSDGQTADEFGVSVAIDGDTIAVGASGDDQRTGSVYLFERIDSTWTETIKLRGADTTGDDRFGFSTAVEGEVVSAGAWNADGVSGRPGAAYVFEKIGGSWSQTQKLLGSDTNAGDFFGLSVAMGGGAIIVGATHAGVNTGVAYVFERPSGVWVQTERLVPSDGADEDAFGTGVATTGDIHVGGAEGHDEAATNAGALYVFQPTSPPVALCLSHTAVAEAASCQANVFPEQIDNGSFDPDGGAVTIDLFPSGPYELGDTQVTLTVMDDEGESSFCDTTVTVVSSLPAEIFSVADSFVRAGARDRNEGANPRLRVRSSGKNRALVAFDVSAIDLTCVTAATLVLNIAENANNWGSSGERTVDAHPLNAGFAEGDGQQAEVPASQSTRGNGSGTTWNCASDDEIANQQTNCDPKWSGGSFDPATAPSVLHVNGQTGVVSWDVTVDVLGGATGWLIKKTVEGQNGKVKYYSKEGAAAAGDPNLGPKLICRC